jgi:hypothetical protein
MFLKRGFLKPNQRAYRAIIIKGRDNLPVFLVPQNIDTFQSQREPTDITKRPA